MPHRLAAQPKPRGKLMLRLQPVSTGKLPGCYLILNPFCDLLILRCSSHRLIPLSEYSAKFGLIRCMFLTLLAKYRCFLSGKTYNFTFGILCTSYSFYFFIGLITSTLYSWNDKMSRWMCVYFFHLYFSCI